MSKPETDHLSRITLIEAIYHETGTLSDENVLYLIEQAHWAIKLDEAGEALADASVQIVTSLSNVIKDLADKLEEKEKNNNEPA